MISHPRLGQLCQLHYRAALRAVAVHHGRVGTVAAVARGPKCRNHAVLFPDGTWTVVPAGNLRIPRP